MLAKYFVVFAKKKRCTLENTYHVLVCFSKPDSELETKSLIFHSYGIVLIANVLLFLQNNKLLSKQPSRLTSCNMFKSYMFYEATRFPIEKLSNRIQ